MIGIAGAVDKALGVVRWFQDKAKRTEQKQAGMTEAENAQLKEAIDAERRMRAVPTPDSDSARKRLRSGRF